MRCFTLTERKSIGLRIKDHDGYPIVRIGERGDVHYVPLSEHFQELARSLPSGARQLMNNLAWANWSEETEELCLDAEQSRYSDEAIVHIATNPEGGISFSSSAFNESLINDEVVEFYDEFPAVGVDILAIGGSENHMLLRMKKRSKFRILRPGAPQDKWFWAKVIWTGRDLLVHPHLRRSRDQEVAA
jgi:hypothetical protein